MTHDKITFGQWIRKYRTNKGLTLQEVADRRFGLEAPTISRIENEQSQVTLLTAFRICSALELTVEEVITIFLENNPTSEPPSSHLLYQISARTDRGLFMSNQTDYTSNESTTTIKKAVLHIQDVKDFVELHQRDSHKCYMVLLQLLNYIVRLHNNRINALKDPFMSSVLGDDDIMKPMRPYDIGEVERILGDSPISHGEMHYPNIGTEAIQTIYQQGGVLIIEDAQYIVKEAIIEAEEKASANIQIGPHAISLLGRLRNTSLERIKLVDICEIDTLLEQSGKIVEAYWKAAQIIDKINQLRSETRNKDAWPSNWSEHEFKIAFVFTVTARWLQYYGLYDLSIIERLLQEAKDEPIR